MANTLTGGYGLRPIGKVGGNVNSTAVTQYEIKSDYSTAIYNGGIVIPVSTGTINRKHLRLNLQILIFKHGPTKVKFWIPDVTKTTLRKLKDEVLNVLMVFTKMGSLQNPEITNFVRS